MDSNTDRRRSFRPTRELPDIFLNHELYSQIHSIIVTLNRHFLILQPDNMCYELLRLLTFILYFPRNIGIHVIRAYAIAGFYCTRERDSVVCYRCGFGFGNLEPGTGDPYEVHQRNAPHCDFFHNRMINIPFFLVTEGGIRRSTEGAVIRHRVSAGPTPVMPGDEVQRNILRSLERSHREFNREHIIRDINNGNELPAPDLRQGSIRSVNTLTAINQIETLNLMVDENPLSINALGIDIRPDNVYNLEWSESESELADSSNRLTNSYQSHTSSVRALTDVAQEEAESSISGRLEEHEKSIATNGSTNLLLQENSTNEGSMSYRLEEHETSIISNESASLLQQENNADTHAVYYSERISDEESELGNCNSNEISIRIRGIMTADIPPHQRIPYDSIERGENENNFVTNHLEETQLKIVCETDMKGNHQDPEHSHISVHKSDNKEETEVNANSEETCWKKLHSSGFSARVNVNIPNVNNIRNETQVTKCMHSLYSNISDQTAKVTNVPDSPPVAETEPVENGMSTPKSVDSDGKDSDNSHFQLLPRHNDEPVSTNTSSVANELTYEGANDNIPSRESQDMGGVAQEEAESSMSGRLEEHEILIASNGSTSWLQQENSTNESSMSDRLEEHETSLISNESASLLQQENNADTHAVYYSERISDDESELGNCNSNEISIRIRGIMTADLPPHQHIPYDSTERGENENNFATHHLEETQLKIVCETDMKGNHQDPEHDHISVHKSDNKEETEVNANSEETCWKKLHSSGFSTRMNVNIPNVTDIRNETQVTICRHSLYSNISDQTAKVTNVPDSPLVAETAPVENGISTSKSVDSDGKDSDNSHFKLFPRHNNDPVSANTSSVANELTYEGADDNILSRESQDKGDAEYIQTETHGNDGSVSSTDIQTKEEDKFYVVQQNNCIPIEDKNSVNMIMTPTNANYEIDKEQNVLKDVNHESTWSREMKPCKYEDGMALNTDVVKKPGDDKKCEKYSGIDLPEKNPNEQNVVVEKSGSRSTFIIEENSKIMVLNAPESDKPETIISQPKDVRLQEENIVAPHRHIDEYQRLYRPHSNPLIPTTSSMLSHDISLTKCRNSWTTPATVCCAVAEHTASSQYCGIRNLVKDGDLNVCVRQISYISDVPLATQKCLADVHCDSVSPVNAREFHQISETKPIESAKIKESSGSNAADVDDLIKSALDDLHKIKDLNRKKTAILNFHKEIINFQSMETSDSDKSQTCVDSCKRYFGMFVRCMSYMNKCCNQGI